MSTKRLLSICIPTYCRPSLSNNVREYLSCPDERFCLHIVDNHSEDGTFENLSKIKDNRLILKRNNQNLGYIGNSIACLSNAPSEYVIFSTDKDFLLADQIPFLLDYLEKERPYFGYVSSKWEYKEPSCIVEYQAGLPAIINGGGFACKHPTGFFFRSELWNEEIQKDYYKDINPISPWPFDMVAGVLGCSFNATIINYSINKAGYKLSTPPITFSYNEDNFYFGKKGGEETINMFLPIVFRELNLSNENKLELAMHIVHFWYHRLTFDLRSLYSNEVIRNRYRLKNRRIGMCEMLLNLHAIYVAAKKCLANSKIPYNKHYLRKDYWQYCSRVVKFFVKQYIKGSSH